MSALMVLLAACGNTGGTSSGSVASKTLVVDDAYTWDFSKDTDPSRGGVDFDADPFFHAIYDSLLTFKLGDSSTPIPLVAQSYTVSPDAKTFTFTIRQDVKFADGTPLTAHDVAFTFNRLMNLHDNPAYLLAGITSATATDNYTFVLVSSVSNPAIPFIVTNPALGIINSKLLMAHGGTDAANAATADTAHNFLGTTSVGSGPYTMASVSTSQVVLKANSNYWGPDKPNFGTVIFRNVAAATQLIEIQKASNQIELSLSGDQAASLNGNNALTVTSFTSPNITFAFCNRATNAACANQHFLNAIRYGIDYQALVSVAGAGSAQAAGVVPRQFLGALPQSQAITLDLTKAKSELQASGIVNPKIELDYTISSTGLNDSLAAKIQANLQAVGITVTLNGQPSSIATPNYRGGKYQLGLAGWAPDYPDPNDYLAFLPGQLVGKRAGWFTGAAPDIESLGAKAGSTSDNATRGQLFQQLQTLLNQESPMLPLIQPGQSVVSTKNLTNVIYSPVWYLDLASIGTH
ncbi:MAG TPA: ABC transporter substrate-binding protein [Candidatus Micrarchaeaceae archaeon]|nr:ABC transporter substrate-binding protein [Candidatus Micrarchaeaceae archaeon]